MCRPGRRAPARRWRCGFQQCELDLPPAGHARPLRAPIDAHCAHPRRPLTPRPRHPSRLVHTSAPLCADQPEPVSAAGAAVSGPQLAENESHAEFLLQPASPAARAWPPAAGPVPVLWLGLAPVSCWVLWRSQRAVTAPVSQQCQQCRAPTTPALGSPVPPPTPPPCTAAPSQQRGCTWTQSQW